MIDLAFVLDPIYVVNLTLCIIILLLGVFGYRKGNTVSLYVGAAFGLFGFSHLSTILGFKDALDIFFDNDSNPCISAGCVCLLHDCKETI